MRNGIVFGDVEAGNRIMQQSRGVAYNPAGETNIARFVNDTLVGGVCYENYTRRSVEMHTAAFVPRWVNRALLWVAFAYPFEQLGVEKVIARVPAYNIAALRFDTSLGFNIEATIKDVYPEGDLLILSMYRADCRHLHIKVRGADNIGRRNEQEE